MSRFKTRAVGVLIAVLGVLGLTMQSAEAYNWSGNKDDWACSMNACIFVTFNTDQDGTGILLGSVKIYAAGGLGTVGHQVSCWNQNGTVIWGKYGGVTDLNSGHDSHTWYPAQVLPGATSLKCKYIFDAEYAFGEVPDQSVSVKFYA